MTKEMLKEKIREVSIAQTYDEYVDALAEHLTVDVAREIFEEILAFLSDKYRAVSTDCHYELLYNLVETPERMRNLGKAEMLKYIGDRIAELKKKYTEEKQ